jgi:hypothetical protein
MNETSDEKSVKQEKMPGNTNQDGFLAPPLVVPDHVQHYYNELYTRLTEQIKQNQANGLPLYHGCQQLLREAQRIEDCLTKLTWLVPLHFVAHLDCLEKSANG